MVQCQNCERWNGSGHGWGWCQAITGSMRAEQMEAVGAVLDGGPKRAALRTRHDFSCKAVQGEEND